MDNQNIDKVLHNDYIMAHILRILDLKEQFKLQKICKRLRFIITTCVWRRDCTDIQMNRNQMSSLTDEEFFDFLRLNVENIRKLTIDAVDGARLQMYFPARYENLLELRINRFKIDDDVILTIVNNCQNLQLFDYNEDRGEECLPEIDLQSIKMLWTLVHLREVILRNLVRTVSYEDLCLLATKVPLERLELYNVRMSGSEWDSNSWSIVLSGLKILKMDCSYTSYSSQNKCLEFIQKCPELQELQLYLPHRVAELCFDKFKHLERMQIKDCQSQQAIWSIMNNSTIKHLEILNSRYHEDNFKVVADVHRECTSLQILKVIQESHTGSSGFWSIVFQSPLTSFQNLQELTLVNQDVCDAFIKSVSAKCPHLQTLHLDGCTISGKYISHLTNMRSLTIINNRSPMPWSNLYSILRYHKCLEYLEIDCMLLTRDDLFRAENIQNMANSLEILKIQRTEKVDNFWEYILNNCSDSFQNVQALHFTLFEEGAYFGYSFYEEFPQLQTLKIEGKEFIAEDMIPTVKHLLYVNCLNMKWSDVVEILQCTRVEIFEIFDMILDFDSTTNPLEIDKKVFKYIRKITVPYSVFKESYRVWLHCLEECRTFQLCCIGHLSQRDVLEPLLETPTVKEKVKTIHANKGLNAIKNYCAENIGKSMIPVCLLNEDTEMLWSSRYLNENCVIIIEI